MIDKMACDSDVFVVNQFIDQQKIKYCNFRETFLAHVSLFY